MIRDSILDFGFTLAKRTQRSEYFALISPDKEEA